MGTPIAFQRIQLSTGIHEIPIYSITDPDIEDTSLRIMTSQGVGCYELADNIEETSIPLHISTVNGVRYVRGMSLPV